MPTIRSKIVLEQKDGEAASDYQPNHAFWPNIDNHITVTLFKFPRKKIIFRLNYPQESKKNHKIFSKNTTGKELTFAFG